MEPKTKLQRRVFNLSLKLPPLTDRQNQWAVKKCFETEGFYRAKKIWCIECGEVFKSEGPYLSQTLLGTTCPCCGKHLKVSNSRKRKYSPQPTYFTIVTTIQGFQVLRHYVASKSCRVGQPAKYDINEAVQNWISPEGLGVTMSRLTSYTCGGAYDRWCWSTSMEVRKDTYDDVKYHIWAKYIKIVRLLPKLKYAEIDSYYHGVTPDIFFRMFLRYPFVETLIKQGEIRLLKYMSAHAKQVAKYWTSIKIAKRHGFDLNTTDLRIYFDYLEMSEAIGRDIKSPKYLCPKDLFKAHDGVLKIKQQHDAKIAAEKKRKQALQSEAAYKASKGKFLGVSFGDDLIQVHVLQNVAEFLEEGTELKHCVFTNEYFKKPDSLILSARQNGTRIETVEVSLRSMDVVQSRGIQNKNTEHHDRVVTLVRKNINLIRKAAATQ